MVKFTEDHEAMLADTVKRVDRLEADSTEKETRIKMLEGFKLDCDRLHKQGEERQRRHEDSLNRNTESMILMAKAVADMNITMTSLLQNDDDAKPVIKLYRDVGAAWKVNKTLWTTIVSIAVGVAAIAAAWKVF